MRRVAGVGTVTLVLTVALAAGAAAQSGAKPGVRRAQGPAPRTSGAFALAGATQILLNANRVGCTVNDVGEQCTSGSVYGGGFWPSGTSDGYIFNGGLQVAAIVPGAGTGTPWAGDTVGVYVFDARGDQSAGRALTPVYDSRNPADLEAWPSAAYVRDTALFDLSLIGGKTASEQDSWVRFWDLGQVQGRAHPMGLLVDQRTLAWNGPQANRDILYVVSRLINVTARDPSRYAGLAAAGYTAEDIARLARLGAAFHDSVARVLQVQLPDSGVAWSNLYVGMGQDPDVASIGNYATAVLPFVTAVAYQYDFRWDRWEYPPDVFAPPFAAAPGFVGTRILRANGGPVRGDSIVTMFTNTTGGGIFPDRFGAAALWRMLSNHLIADDGSCNAPLGTPLCVAIQSPADARWYLATGPYPVVGGGQSVVVLVAYVFAPPLAAWLTRTGAYPDYKPGFPATGARLATGVDTVRDVERIAGWVSHQDADADGRIEASEVRTVPYSLLGKAAAAQAFADRRFLGPRAPDPPRFAVLPGDGQATVVWERSTSESVGDPYFPAAADPLSALYDPNFRQFDVEGYRVWRGTTLANLQLVAQFDHTGTFLTDFTGQVFGPGEVVGRCAPDLGVVDDCRADFLHGGSRTVPLAGGVVQIPPGGRVVLADGRVVVLRADTAVTGGGSGRPALQDTGVPFAFVDAGLANGTTYVYAVTTFDVNSVNGGVTSLESELVGKTVTPRPASVNLQGAVVTTEVRGGDGTVLDTAAAFPAIDPQSGTFSGPIPPTNGGRLSLPVEVQELLPAGEFSVRIDSVSPGFPSGYGSPPPRLYVTTLGGAQELRDSVELSVWYSGNPGSWDDYTLVASLVPFDSARSRRFGVPLGPDARMLARFDGKAPPLSATSPGVARAAYLGDLYQANASRWLANSRWHDEPGAEPSNPTIDPFGSRTHTNGALAGVSVIYSPIAYRLPIGGGAAAHAIPSSRNRPVAMASIAAWHPADILVRWGAGGAVTVRDSTHRVDVPFKRDIQPGYGFLSAQAIAAAGVTSTQLNDNSSGVTYDPSVVSYYSLRTLRPVCGTTAFGVMPPCVGLQEAARLEQVDVTNDGVADGTGIGLVIDGEPFFMLMTQLPAAGTVWHLRALGGGLLSATCSPALPSYYQDLLPGSQPTYCIDYTYTPPAARAAYVPGLRYTLRVVRQFGVDTAALADLAAIHTVPDPLYFTNAAGSGAAPAIRFVNLPDRAIVRIYSSSGILVAMVTHNDPTLSGEVVWDVRNRGGRFVASGVYFYLVETPDGRRKIGRFTVVQQAWP